MSKDIDVKLSGIQDQINDISDVVHKVDKEIALTQQTLKQHTAHDEILDAQIVKQLQAIGVTLQKNTESLIEHMRRTEAVEHLIQKIDSRLEPLEVKHIREEAVRAWRQEFFLKTMKIVGAIGTIIAIVIGIKSF